MSFFNIYPRNTEYQGWLNHPIPLQVILKDGVKTSTDIDFDRIDLAGGKSLFKNNSGINDKFTVTILLHDEDDIFGGRDAGIPASAGAITNLINALDFWIREAEPFYIVTDAVSISKNTLWLVTEQKNRKQDHKDGYVEWDLTFTRYEEVVLGNFNKSTDVITKALEKKKTQGKNTNSKTTLKSKLKKCKYSVLVYSEKKKVVNCVKVMQEILYNEGCYSKNSKKKDVVDGWYGKSTREAVKKFKDKYRKDYGLDKYNNQLGYKGWQVMCGTAKKVVTSSNNSFSISAVKSKSQTTIKTKMEAAKNAAIKKVQKTVSKNTSNKSAKKTSKTGKSGKKTTKK